MTDAARQKALLAGLAFVVALVLLPRLFRSDDAAPAGTPNLAARSPGAVEKPLPEVVVDLNLAGLAPRAGHAEIGRDPWRFAPKPVPPAPVRPVIRPPVVEPPRVIERPPEPVGPQPPSSDHLAFLGSFGPSAAPIAVVRGRDDVWAVRKGDVLENQFTVENIGLESIDIGFVGFPDTPPRRLGFGG
jgi:hypothetical protein